MKFEASDGEILQLDWYPKHFKQMPPETPIVVFVPGMFGTSQDCYSLEFCKKVHARLGWRTFVLNRRLFVSPLYGKKIISYDHFSDWREILEGLRRIYPEAEVYLVGVSMGALNIQKYLVDHCEDPLVKAAVTISSPFDAEVADTHISESYLLNKAACGVMVSMFREHLHHEEFLELCRDRGIDPEHVKLAKNVKEFHERVTCKDVGAKTPKEYLNSMSSAHVIGKLKTPVLSVNSVEDPLVPFKCVPIRDIELNPHIIQLMVGGGGHIEYFHGMKREFVGFVLILVGIRPRLGLSRCDAPSDSRVNDRFWWVFIMG